MARHTPGHSETDGRKPDTTRTRTTRTPAETPTDLAKKSWWGVLKRIPKEFQADNLPDWAAALTYYGVLSVFPGLLVLVSVLGLLGGSTIKSLIDSVGSLAPGAVRDILTSVLTQLQNSQGGAGIALFLGIAIALWSASGYIAAFMRAANAVYDIGEGRPIWKTLPARLALTIAVIVLLAAMAVGVVFTGTLAQKTGQALRLGDTAIMVWNIAKWPVLVLLFSLVIGLLYWAAPNVKRGFRWVTPGSVLAVLIWLIASAAFGLYVANFSNYDKTYGSLTAVIIFLIWMWISNIAVLLGLEFNAELERARAIESGHPPAQEPYAEPRDTRAL